MEYFSDRPVLFSIETPAGGALNYDQRVNRQVFFEHLSCIKSSLRLENGDDSYTFYSSRKCGNMKELVMDYLKSSLEEKKKLIPVTGDDEFDGCLVEL